LELLPAIIQNVVQPRNLALFCLVNKTFCEFTRPFLYHTIAVSPEHHEEKVIKIFRTLSSSPGLAKHVRKLEIRDVQEVPGGLHMDEIIDYYCPGLENTVNLRCFIWTREGALHPNILFSILKHPSLQELEINGNHPKNYEYTVLLRFTSLRRIKLITPSAHVVGILPAWLESLVDPLQSLTIVCGSAFAVTDALLEQVSRNLSGLDELHLTGCLRVTHEGLLNALRHNENGIKSLTIQRFSSLLDLQELDRQCRKGQLLNRLTSLTINLDDALLDSAWVVDIPSLISSSPLESFQLYCTTVFMAFRNIQLDGFIAALVSTHGPRLKHLSVHRLPISMKAFHDVCAGFTNLEHLFVVVDRRDLGLMGNSLSKATKLQAVHIHFVVVRINGLDLSYASPKDALHIVKQCGSAVTQIGSGDLVWQVVREATQAGEYETTIVGLSPGDRLEVPERFLGT